MLLENIGFENINPLLENSVEDQWPFWNRHTSIRNSTPYRLYINGSPDGLLSTTGNGIAGIILLQCF